MIQWPCRQCGEGLEIPDSLSRDAVECPSCGVFSRPPDEHIPRVITAQERQDPPSAKPGEYPIDRAVNRRLKGLAGLDLFGSLSLLAGLGVTLGGVLADTSYLDTHNIGLLNDRLVMVAIGVGMVTCGVLLIGFSTSTKAIIRAIQADTSD